MTDQDVGAIRGYEQQYTTMATARVEQYEFAMLRVRLPHRRINRHHGAGFPPGRRGHLLEEGQTQFGPGGFIEGVVIHGGHQTQVGVQHPAVAVDYAIIVPGVDALFRGE